MRAVDFGMDRTQSGPARELWANVRFWHKADIPRLSSDVRFRG